MYCDHCSECEHKSYQIDEVKYWLHDVLSHLYDGLYFNEDDFERSLEELAHVVDIRLPENNLMIQRKPIRDKIIPIKDELIRNFMRITQTHIEQLNTKA